MGERLEDRRVLATIGWDSGGDGTSWDDPLNWNPNQVPTIVDDAIIDVPGDVVIDIESDVDAEAKTIQSTETIRTLGGGTLDIAESANIDGGLIHFGSEIVIGGDLRLGGTSSFGLNSRVEGAGTLIFMEGSDATFSRSRINVDVENAGTLRVSPAQGLGQESTFSIGTWLNQPTGNLTLRNGGVLNISGPGSFTNLGTILKTESDSSALTAPSIIHSGVLELQAGTLTLDGAVQSDADIQVPIDTTLVFDGSADFGDGNVIDGAGTFRFEGTGPFNFAASEFLPASVVDFQAFNAQVTISNTLPDTARLGQIRSRIEFNADQVLTGPGDLRSTISGNGDVTLEGDWTTNQGIIEGSGELTIAENSRLTTFGASNQVKRKFGVSGRLVHQNGGLRFFEETTILPNGTLELVGDSDLDLEDGVVLRNQGRLTKTGGGKSDLGFIGELRNEGTLTAENGELDLGLPVQHSSTSIDVGELGTIRFSQPITFDPGQNLTGDGHFVFAATLDFSEVNVAPAGSIEFRGDVTIGNTIPAATTITSISGTARFNADQTLNSVPLFANSRIDGTGDLLLTGTFSSSSTALNGTGTVTIDQGARWTANSSVSILQPLINRGRITKRSGDIFLAEAIVNTETGTLRFENPIRINNALGSLLNEGEIVYVANGETRVNSAFDNRGSLSVQNGNLDFRGAFNSQDANYSLASGTSIQVRGAGLQLDQNSSLRGDGTVIGNVTNSGIVSPGIEIGTLTIQGSYTQAADGVVDIEAEGASASQHDQLLITGAANLDGTVQIRVAPSYQPQPEDSLDVIQHSSVVGAPEATVVGATNTVEIQSDATATTVIFGQRDTNVVTPTFRGRAEPNSTVELTAQVDGQAEFSLGTTQAGPSGDWSINVATGLGNERYRIVARNPSDPNSKPLVNVFADMNLGDLDIEGFESITIFDDAFFFTPFGRDLDGVADSDDELIEFDDAQARLFFGDRIPTGVAGDGQRLRDGTVDLDRPFITFENKVAEAKLLSGVLPFIVERVDFGRVDGPAGQPIDEFEVTGRFNALEITNPSIEGETQASNGAVQSVEEKAATTTISAHLEEVSEARKIDPDAPIDTVLVETALRQWLNPSHPEANDCDSQLGQGLACRIEALGESSTVGGLDATLAEFSAFSSLVTRLEAVVPDSLVSETVDLLSSVQNGVGRFLVSTVSNISSSTRLEDFRNFFRRLQVFETLLEAEGPVFEPNPGESMPPTLEELFASISESFFTGVLDRIVDQTIAQRSYKPILDAFDVIEYADLFLLSKQPVGGPGPDDPPLLTDLADNLKGLIDRLIDVANAEQDSRAAATVSKFLQDLSAKTDEEQEDENKGKPTTKPFSKVANALADLVDLFNLNDRYTFERDPEAQPFATGIPDDQFVFVLGDLPKDENGFTFDSVVDFFDASNSQDLNLLTPNQTKFSFKAQFEDGDFRALDLPAVGIAFQQTVGVTTTAGIVSLDSSFGGGEGLVTEIGFDAVIDVIGGEGLEGDFGVEATGAFKLYDNLRAVLEAETTLELGFKTDEAVSDSFFLEADASVTFGLGLELSPTSGLRVTEIGLSEIAADNFAAAFGGTPVSDAGGSQIPEDAFLVLTAEREGDTPAVTLDLREDAEHLLSFGRVKMEVPNAGVPFGRNKATNEPGVALIVDKFFIDLDDTGVSVSRDTGFSAEVENLGNAFEELGIPDYVTVEKLAFEGGPGFDAGTDLLDFQLVMSLDVNLPIEVPVSASFSNVIIDVAAVSQGDFLDALRFGAPGSDEFAGLQVDIGPIEFSDALKFDGKIGIGQFGFTPLDADGNPLTGQEESSLAFFLEGSFEVADFAGISGSVFLSEYGPIAMSLGVEGLELPIFNTGLAFTSFEGSVLLNAPDFPVIEDPLDLLDQSSEFDFQSLATRLSFDQMVDLARDLVVDNSQRLARNESPLATWETDLLLAVTAGIGIAGDPTDTLLVETTIGARFEVERDPNAESRGFQMFGFGTATVMPSTENEVNLGTAALLLEFPQSGPIASFAFEINPRDSKIPVEAKIGGQVRGVFNEQGEYLSTEVRISGEAKAEGVAEGSVGGILVFQPENFFGVFAFEFDISPSDDLQINGDLFVQMNTSNEFQELDRAAVEAIEALDELIVGNEAPGVEPGFGLFARIGVEYTDVLDADGRLDVLINDQGFSGSLELEGQLFGGVIEASLLGELTSDDNGFDLLIDLKASIVVIPEFLEANGAVILEIKDDRFRRFSGDVSATIFGLETGAGLAINEHACMTLSFNDGTVEVPLPGGDCGISDEPEPTRMTVGDVSQVEGNSSQSAANVPVSFENRKLIGLPDGIQPVLLLQAWATVSAENSATADVDFDAFTVRRFEVPFDFVEDQDGPLSQYRLPEQFSIPVDIFGDQLVEEDETLLVFVQVIPAEIPALPDTRDALRINPTIVRGDDGFGTITIVDDDIVPDPPEDAIVFFDFEDVITTSTGVLVLPENQPDASRPELTFDADAVSAITHSTGDLRFDESEGLPIDLFGLGRAATADLWKTYINQEEGAQTVDPPFPGQPTLVPDGEESLQYFEFTVAPNEGDDAPNLRIDGIDFWNRADLASTWELKYSKDDFDAPLATGTAFGGAFGHQRVVFEFPPGLDGTLVPGESVTFRIYGPSQGPINAGASVDQVVNEWRVDNLALVGGEVFVSVPTIDIDDVQVDPPVEMIDTTTGSVPVEDSDPPPIIIPDFVPPLPPPFPSSGFVPFTFNGFLSGAETWFDGDLDGEVSVGESVAETDAVGRTQLLLGDDFDTNGNGKIDLDEGVIVSRAGLDTAKGITQSFAFTAPYGARSITPLSTLATSLAQNHDRSPEQANSDLIAALNAGGSNLPADFNVFDDSSLLNIVEGDESRVQPYLTLVQVHQTVALFAPVIADTSGSLEQAGRDIFDSLAEEVSDGALDLQSAVTLRDVLRSLAVPANDALVDAVATIAARSNQLTGSTLLPAGKNFLVRVNQIEKQVFGDVAAAISETVRGDRSIDRLLADFTMESIDTQSRVELIGPVLPVALRIGPSAVIEPIDGSAEIEFAVTLSAPALVPVSVDFRTLDRSASDSSGDYDALSGTLEFAPGETTKTISVTVNADEVQEKVESFYLQLRDPQHALLAEDQVLGRILPNANETTIPDELSLESQQAAVGQPVTIAIRLPGLVSGSVDWGDGVSEPVTIVDSNSGTLLAMQHVYDAEGDFQAEFLLEFETAQQSTVRGEFNIRQVVQREDPNNPGQFAIEIDGTDRSDLIQVKLTDSGSFIGIYVDGQETASFARDAVSQIRIDAGASSDRIHVDRRVDTPVFVDAGEGNDVVFTGAGDDIVLGGDGRDRIFVRGGNDIVDAGAGNDLIDGSSGDDRLLGGMGNDLIFGGDGRDQLNGSDGRDILMGGDGDDGLTGGDGKDRLLGGNGADSIDAGDGNDVALGGSGDDTVLGRGGADRIYGGRGNDRIFGGQNSDRLIGDSGDDVILGEAGNDFIFGGLGSDNLSGGEGNDFLKGSFGDDTLLGDIGNDRLFGGPGDDRLVGGPGHDHLRGGSGNDDLFDDVPPAEGEFVDLSADLSIAAINRDVNRDGRISSLDALLVINELNRRGGASQTQESTVQYDSNDDGRVSAIDALAIINYLGTVQDDLESVADEEVTSLIGRRGAQIDDLASLIASSINEPDESAQTDHLDKLLTDLDLVAALE